MVVSSFTDKSISLNLGDNYMTAGHLSLDGTFVLHLIPQILIVKTSTKGTLIGSCSFYPIALFFIIHTKDHPRISNHYESE